VLILPYMHHSHDYWELEHKVNFDGDQRLMIVNDGVTDINVQVDLYSDWKEWLKLRRNARFAEAIRTIGGDPTVAGEFAGGIYFLKNGWQVRVNHSVEFDGDVFSDDFDSPFIAGPGVVLSQNKVANLVDTVTTDLSDFELTIPSVAQMAAGVWSEILTTYLTADTAGRMVSDTHGQARREIYIDTELVPTGNGYQQTPYNNWSDAVDDAEANGITSLIVISDATVDRQLKNFTIRGVGNPTLDLDGQNMDRSILFGMKITGSYTGNLQANDCDVLSVSGIEGHFHDCALSDGGVLTMSDTPSEATLFLSCASAVAGTDTPILDCNSTDKDISIRHYSGGLEIRNFTQMSITIDLVSGNVILASSCTGGTIVLRGIGTLTDNSAGTTVVSTGLVSPTSVADAVWDELIAGHTTADTFGKILNDLNVPFEEGAVTALITPTTTQCATTLTSTNADDWDETFIRFTSGALAGRVREVTASAVTNSVLTYDAFPVPPGNTDTFVLVNR